MSFLTTENTEATEPIQLESVLPTLQGEILPDQRSTHRPIVGCDLSQAAMCPHCGRNPENHDRPKLVAELLLQRAGLRYYGELRQLEDRLLWLVRSDKGLALLYSDPWPPEFLRSPSEGVKDESNRGPVALGNVNTGAAGVGISIYKEEGGR